MPLRSCFLIVYAPDDRAGSAEPPLSDGFMDSIDLDRLRDLSVVLEDGMHEVVSTFLEDTPRLIGDLQAACLARDWPRLESIAHSLKSSAGIFGAKKMVLLCKALETAAQDGPSDCIAQVTDIVKEYQRVETALYTYIGQGTRRE